MTVVVTGASGHIGGNLVRALLADGRRVRCMVRDDTRAIDGLDVERVRGDVLQPETLRAAFDGAEVVYHLAAIITIEGDPTGIVRRTNVEGPRNVAQACLDAGVRRLVHFSSIHAFQQHPLRERLDESRPFTEDDPSELMYDRTKAAGHKEILAAVDRGLDAVVVHPTAVMGPIDYKPSAVGQVLLDLYHRRLPSLVDGGFDWVDVRDVVAGAMAAEKKGLTGRNYLLSGKWRSVRELAEIAQGVTGVRRPRFTSPMWLARVGVPFAGMWARATGRRPLYTYDSLRALVSNRAIACDRAREELGYASRDLKETITDAMDWFRDHGVLSSPATTA